MIILLQNHSDKISEVELNLMAQACEIQYKNDYAPSRGLDPRGLSVATVDPGCKYILATIKDKAPANDGTQADHFLNEDGEPEIEVFTDPILKNGGSILEGPNSVSIALSHEVLEYDADPFTNEWIDTQGLLADHHGKVWKEVCNEVGDPVEDGFYAVDVDGIKVDVSNFILPDWSNPNVKSAKRDFLGVLPFEKCFTMSENGYLIVRDRSGQETDVFAATYPTWKIDKKRSKGSRAYRRRNMNKARAI
jgi:hypothetical protein